MNLPDLRGQELLSILCRFLKGLFLIGKCLGMSSFLKHFDSSTHQHVQYLLLCNNSVVLQEFVENNRKGGLNKERGDEKEMKPMVGICVSL